MRKVLAVVAAVATAGAAVVGLALWRSYNAALKEVPFDEPFDEPGGGW